MLFCQLGRANSLREIVGGLACTEGKLKHLGVEKAPRRSTLAYANERRNWELFQMVFGQLLHWSKLRAGGSDVLFDRISIDPNTCHGQACVKGTRMPVHQIVRMMANGDTIEDLLSEYPFLSREDIMGCLDYAADLSEEQVTPIPVADH